MEINQKILDSFLALNDAEIQQKLQMIARSLGIDEKKVATQTADVSKIRSMIRTASAEDINRLVNTLGRDRAEVIIKTLGGGE